MNKGKKLSKNTEITVTQLNRYAKSERLIELNKVAITQMKSLFESNSMKKLK